MAAGRMDRRCYFARRDAVADRYGNVSSGGWVALVTRWGRLQFERGSERLEAGRTESAVAAMLTIYADSATRGITPADKVTIDGVAYAIRTIVEPPRTGQIEMTIERGVEP